MDLGRGWSFGDMGMAYDEYDGGRVTWSPARVSEGGVIFFPVVKKSSARNLRAFHILRPPSLKWRLWQISELGQGSVFDEVPRYIAGLALASERRAKVVRPNHSDLINRC